MKEHTELPWEIDFPIGILGKNREIVCDFTSLYVKDADFIVRACNLHYDLLKTCKALLELIEFEEIESPAINLTRKIAKEVIQKAEGEV